MKDIFQEFGKREKPPDLFNICKFVEYMEIDYNLLFFSEGKKKALNEQMINRFLKFVEIETMESKVLWERKTNILSKDYVFICKLEYGEELRLYKFIVEDEICYKLVLNGNLLYTTEGNENNIEGNRIVKSLYQYLRENDYESMQKTDFLAESIEIIKKYIKED